MDVYIISYNIIYILYLALFIYIKQCTNALWTEKKKDYKN